MRDDTPEPTVEAHFLGALAEHHLHAPAELVDVVLDALPDAVLVVDHDGTIVFANRQTTALFGYETDELIGRPVDDLVPERFHGHAGHRTRYLAAPRPRAMGAELELFGQRKDGSEFPVEISLSPFGSGSEISAIAVVRDTSGARRLRDQLRLSFDQSSVAMSLAALDGRWMHVNQALCDLVGYSRQELHERTFHDITHPDDLDADLDLLNRLLAGEIPSYEMEKRYVTKSGAVTWVHLSVGAVRHPDGTPDYLVCQIQDINDRVLAREELAARERDRQALISAAGDGIIVVSLPDTVILEANPALNAMLGYEPGELTGVAVSSLVVESSLEETPPEIERLLQGESVTNVRSLQRKNGTVAVVETRATLLQESRGLIVARDITERIALDKRLRDAQRLESLGRLTGGIAHDFNNLLHTILGYTDLALRAQAPGSRAVVALEETQRAARRAAELTEQMLAYAGAANPVRREVDLNSVIAPLEAQLAPGVQLTLDLAPGLPPITADPDQIGEMLLALTSNAAEACADGGAIIVATARIELAAGELDEYRFGDKLSSGAHVQLRVADTGAGMDAATVDRMFDPFFTTKFLGRGLGLAAALGILRAHGAGVRVDSRPEAGTIVTVVFPAGP